eukprot:2153356-Rhodomonas_salina.1
MEGPSKVKADNQELRSQRDDDDKAYLFSPKLISLKQYDGSACCRSVDGADACNARGIVLKQYVPDELGCALSSHTREKRYTDGTADFWSLADEGTI